jgi:hypothetical protein
MSSVGKKSTTFQSFGSLLDDGNQDREEAQPNDLLKPDLFHQRGLLQTAGQLGNLPVTGAQRDPNR